MRKRAALLLALTAIPIFITGCGGDDEQKSETVPSTPELTVPGDETAPEVTESDTDTDTDTDTDSGGGSGQSDGGAAAPVAPAPAPTPAPAPRQPPQTGGAQPNQQQNQGQNRGNQNNGGADFCGANPGAC
ncbi:MAG: hypothetical protein H0T15_00545 [Thermoleophilaceae bacterium]|nr:hypothetical protein [Thermoleophilaceae bacterium]